MVYIEKKDFNNIVKYLKPANNLSRTIIALKDQALGEFTSFTQIYMAFT